MIIIYTIAGMFLITTLTTLIYLAMLFKKDTTPKKETKFKNIGGYQPLKLGGEIQSPCDANEHKICKIPIMPKCKPTKTNQHNAHYKKQKTDTFQKMTDDATFNEQMGFIKGNIDKYNWRDKGQDEADCEKIIVYAKQGIAWIKANQTIESKEIIEHLKKMKTVLNKRKNK